MYENLQSANDYIKKTFNNHKIENINVKTPPNQQLLQGRKVIQVEFDDKHSKLWQFGWGLSTILLAIGTLGLYRGLKKMWNKAKTGLTHHKVTVKVEKQLEVKDVISVLFPTIIETPTDNPINNPTAKK